MTVGIIFASTHGHTGRVASRLAGTIRADGLDAAVAEVGEKADRLVAQCDAVLVAGSVHKGSHQAELVEFVRRHRRVLQGLPSGFVSVSLTAAEPDDEEMRAETHRMVDEFVEDTEWTPDRTTTVAGAFQFSKYSPFERLIMRLIARRHQTRIEPWEDLELTDWGAVEGFAHDFARRVLSAHEHDRVSETHRAHGTHD